MLKYAEFRSLDKEPRFNQKDVTTFRSRMIRQIALNHLEAH